MKLVLQCLGVLAVVATTAPAIAASDDAKWVARCIRDNADAKSKVNGKAIPVEVISKYCTCMNDKMDDNETLSISAWEKTHRAERQACDRESGWDKL